MSSYQQEQADSPDVVVSVLRTDHKTIERLPLNEEQTAIAVAAAEAAFTAAGVTPNLVATANWELEGWDIAGFPEPGPTEWFDIAMVEGDAVRAAKAALCARWPEMQDDWIELQLYALDDDQPVPDRGRERAHAAD